jgi:hypothetical protein
MIVICVLQELKDEANVLGVELSGKAEGLAVRGEAGPVQRGIETHSVTDDPIILSLASIASWTSRRVSGSIRE